MIWIGNEDRKSAASGQIEFAYDDDVRLGGTSVDRARVLAYMPQLDGVRAVAVSLVLVGHFVWWAPAFVRDLAGTGVRLFFVLSGFLITRILIDYRDRYSIGEAAKVFYWRRALRLVPALYAAIAIAWLADIGKMREDWPVHALYLSNFLVAARGMDEPVGHLWSLAVEEQFYLAWFAVVICLPRRWLFPAIASGLAIGPIFRLSAYLLQVPGAPQVMVFGAADYLATGAFLALISLTRPAWFTAIARRAVLVPGCAALVGASAMPEGVLQMLVWPLATNIAAASLVAAAAAGTSYRWLGVSPLRQLGKISYGVYLYHVLVLLLLQRYGLLSGIAGTGDVVALIALTIAAASVSWLLLERPIMSMKEMVPRFLARRPAS